MRARVCATNSSIEPSRIGSGSITVAAPHSHVAWIAVTSGRVVGPRIATWAPGATPARLERGGHRAGVVVELAPRHLVFAVPSAPADPRNVIAPGPSAAASRRGQEGRQRPSCASDSASAP